MAYNPLVVRETGEFGLAIGTDLALAGVSGRHPDLLTTDTAKDYPLYLVNLRTLHRNLYQAVGSGDQLKIRATDMSRILIAECQILIDAVKQIAPDARVEFYHCQYVGIPRKFPDANLRKVSTEKQLHYANSENSAITDALPQLKNQFTVKEYNVDLTDDFETTALITHLPVDLLSRYQFTDLSLLESHTGRVKKNIEFYTKLTNGRKLTRIPFGRFSIQLFGDNGYFFAPFPKKIRDEVLTIAERDKWSPATTNEKIRYSINKIYNPILKERLLSLI